MKLIFFIILTILKLDCNSQVEFIIKQMNIGNIKIDYSQEEISPDMGDGPFIGFDYFLINRNEAPIILDNANGLEFKISYKYNDIECFEYLTIWGVENIIRINFNDTLKLYSEIPIFLGTDLLDIYKDDYSFVLIEILPTFEYFLYLDNNLLASTCKVKKVKVYSN